MDIGPRMAVMDLLRLAPADWAHENFAAADLGDKRRTDRLVESARRAARRPGGSLPHMMHDPAALDGFYRLMDGPTVTHASVIGPHVQRTRGRMRAAADPVLILKDITELDFTTHRTLTGLGQIGNGSRRGYLCHNSLAVDARTKDVIGLADQRLFVRPHVGKTETRAQKRARKDRQSRLWVASSDAVGAAPAGRHWIEVCDREADTFEYLGRCFATGRSFVVRSKSNRNIEYEQDGGRQPGKLHDYVRRWPAAAGKRVAVRAKAARPATAREPARPAQKARDAQAAIAFGRVWLVPPRGHRSGQERLPVWVVRVWEPDPPPAADRLEWILLVKDPITTAAAAVAYGGYYEDRWVVEDYHKGQKTGCRIEDCPFTSEARLEPAIAFLSVVAVLLLQLRGLGRSPETKDRPARAYVPPLFVDVLSQWRWPDGRGPQEMTAEAFVWALGRLGGHQNRKRDGPPGWIVLWRGWTQLLARVDAVRRLQPQRSGET
jgi:hypothetical protein